MFLRRGFCALTVLVTTTNFCAVFIDTSLEFCFGEVHRTAVLIKGADVSPPRFQRLNGSHNDSKLLCGVYRHLAWPHNRRINHMLPPVCQQALRRSQPRQARPSSSQHVQTQRGNGVPFGRQQTQETSPTARAPRVGHFPSERIRPCVRTSRISIEG